MAVGSDPLDARLLMATAVRRPATIRLPSLSGGLNVRDALTELAPSESPEMLNATLDERGGIRKRLGYSARYETPAAAAVSYLYDSRLLDKLLVYTQADGCLYYDPGDETLTLAHTFSAASPVSIVDFVGACYLIHPADGLFTSADGVTWTAVAPTSGLVATVASATGSPGLVLPVGADTVWTQLTAGTKVDVKVRASGADPGQGLIRRVASVDQAAGTVTLDTNKQDQAGGSGNVTFDDTCGIYLAGSWGQIPAGDQLAVWQNKLWVANSTSTLLSFSAPGDASKWDSSDDAGSNHVREGNDFPIVCLYGATGTDFQTNPSLIVGKRSGGRGSVHRVTDAATGDYVTLNQEVGPAGPHAITSVYGVVYILSTAGVFATDGVAALTPVAQKLEPLFRPDSLDYTQASGYCAGRHGDRLYFSVARQDATGNDLALEYHPLFQAFTRRDDAVACYANYSAGGDLLLGAATNSTGQIWQLNTGGDDNGDPIVFRYLTRVFEPDQGYQARLRHVRVLMGEGQVTLTVLANFQTEGPDKTLTVSSGGFAWDTAGRGWDEPGVGWSEGILEGYTEFWVRKVGRAFQLRFEETSTIVRNLPSLLGDGTQIPVGAVSLYGIELQFDPLAPA